MGWHSIKNVYDFEKKELLKNLEPQDKPLAFILGGQPASGKSNLANTIIRQNPDKRFLFVNGDIYRSFHPQAKDLIKDPHTYSEKTQIFSNFFTEELIKEAIKNKYNIIVEGTMRNPQVPLNTAKMFKENGFYVEALAISAPAIFTEIGLYTRYQEEINFQGVGRLADIKSHHSAVEGILNSLDALYDKKVVDKIQIYSYQGKSHIITFEQKNERWNYDVLPSEEVIYSREKQLKDKEMIESIIQRGDKALENMNAEIKNNLIDLLNELEEYLRNLEENQTRGFKR
ncbi:zeta toxin family protein [Riemerella anatipestifer]|uniref:zeta toxin family protein n=1 Tax=Riemerella anatipestifer TaxID=34085 RepID=UPI0021D5CA39|nr:zeta toxin family protein [Riemerella anatipestifer]MCU7559122.1 zeta toxin family protein [Riemerella anatipestifer]MDY3317510.1 zeta toxin family protein [Riemerella anatipestifer]MDY3400694.1 zeta toxin family protein [Riemerella anatipestifer]